MTILLWIQDGISIVKLLQFLSPPKLDLRFRPSHIPKSVIVELYYQFNETDAIITYWHFPSLSFDSSTSLTWQDYGRQNQLLTVILKPKKKSRNWDWYIHDLHFRLRVLKSVEILDICQYYEIDVLETYNLQRF